MWPWGLLVLYIKVSEVQVTSNNKVLHALKLQTLILLLEI